MENLYCNTYCETPGLLFLYFCLLLPLVQYSRNDSRVMKLASITHCHIFSYSLCPLAAFQGEMVEFLLFLFRYFTTIICDYHQPSFLKLKVAVACWSNLQHEQICTKFTNVSLVFEMQYNLKWGIKMCTISINNMLWLALMSVLQN